MHTIQEPEFLAVMNINDLLDPDIQLPTLSATFSTAFSISSGTKMIFSFFVFPEGSAFP